MKFSIITPVLNMERFIASTIESVLSQEGDFSIEYIIVDDSTDETPAIVSAYAKKIADGVYPIKCASITMHHMKRTTGHSMYSAINDGFAIATGDVYAWINADDMYRPGAFAIIARSLATFPDIQWIKGITGTIDENGKELKPGVCTTYIQQWIVEGMYGQEAYFIEQDSVFWRKELWKKSGEIPKALTHAGDYWLWREFARRAPLVSLNAPISYFRKRAGQMSKDVAGYKKEQYAIRPRRGLLAMWCRVFFAGRARITRMFPNTEPLFMLLYPLFFLFTTRVEYMNIRDGVPKLRQTNKYVIPRT